MSTHNALTKLVIRRFARRARAYTCAYYSLAFGDDTNNNTGEKMSPAVIEKMVTAFKTHTCALDFDRKFIKTESTSN